MKRFGRFQHRELINLIIVFLPLLVAIAWLYYKPYYMFVLRGDPDYHLTRAREILESPLKGFLWDSLRCYPQGKAINHQPLYHAITAGLWYIGGVRFAFSVMAILQMLITIGVASFFARRYGTVAGFSSGALAFFTLRPDTLTVPTPSALLFPLILLSIYLATEGNEFAYVPLLASLWLHPGALFIFPLVYYLLFSKKGKGWGDWLLFSSWIFWAGYWSYFGLLKGQMGQQAIAFDATAALGIVKDSLFSSLEEGYLSILALGAYGFYLIKDKVEAKVILFSTLAAVLFTLIYGDYNRYPQYVILPLAIFGGASFQKGYDELLGAIKNRAFASLLPLLLILVLFVKVPNVITATLPIPMEKEFISRYGFEWPNTELKTFIETNTKEDEIIYADDGLVDKIVWMAGRKVSGCGVYGAPRGFVPQTQRLNLFFIPAAGKTGEVLFKPIVIEEGLNLSVEQMHEVVYSNPKVVFRQGGAFVITKDMVGR